MPLGKKPPKYRCEATSVEGFLQQLAVAYITTGYWFYVTGEIPVLRTFFSSYFWPKCRRRVATPRSILGVFPACRGANLAFARTAVVTGGVLLSHGGNGRSGIVRPYFPVVHRAPTTLPS
jgi:hypothetical protein